MSSMSDSDSEYSEENYGTNVDNRVICLIDMDCYEIQVHDKPWMKGKPRVVVNSSGRILAVSYEAKLLGINRESTPYANQAKAIYGNLIINEIPNRGANPYGPPRPDSSIAREATGRVVTAIKEALDKFNELFGDSIFEYSSGDEFYINFDMLDGLENGQLDNLLSYLTGKKIWETIYLYNETVVGRPTSEYSQKRVYRLIKKRSWSCLEAQEVRLLIGAGFSKMVTNHIRKETGYKSSVGVASNKLMAKICSGVHKPGSITVSAPSGFEEFAEYIKIEDIPGLGQNTGKRIKKAFSVTTMSELRFVDVLRLQRLKINNSALGYKAAEAIIEKANGICSDPVVPRNCEDTSGVSRSLKNLYDWDEIMDMTRSLCEEMVEKLEFEKRFNGRIPSAIKLKIKADEGLSESSRITDPSYFVRKYSKTMYRQLKRQLNGFNFDDPEELAYVDQISIVCSF